MNRLASTSRGDKRREEVDGGSMLRKVLLSMLLSPINFLFIPITGGPG